MHWGLKKRKTSPICPSEKKRWQARLMGVMPVTVGGIVRESVTDCNSRKYEQGANIEKRLNWIHVMPYLYFVCVKGK